MLACMFIIRASFSLRMRHNLVHIEVRGSRLPRQHPEKSRGHREWTQVFEACSMLGSRSGRIESQSGSVAIIAPGTPGLNGRLLSVAAQAPRAIRLRRTGRRGLAAARSCALAFESSQLVLFILEVDWWNFLGQPVVSSIAFLT